MGKFSVEIIFILIVVIFSCSAPEHENKPETEVVKSELNDLPEILDGLPLMIEVTNDPKIIKAVRDPKDSTIYIWKLKTYVKAVSDDISIIEFGDYAKNENGEWYLHNYTEKPFKEKEFSEWYFLVKRDQFTWKNVNNGLLKMGKMYVDPVNWSERADSIHAQTGLWYYIGIDSQGKKVCGYDYYENLPELTK